MAETEVQSYDIPEELLEDHAELVRLDGVIYDLTEELKTKGRAFWHAIEKKYNLRGKRLKLNDETKKIEVLPDEPPMQLPPGIPGRMNKHGRVVPIRIDEDAGTALPSIREAKGGKVARAIRSILPQ